MSAPQPRLPTPIVIWDPRFPPSPLLIGDRFVLVAGARHRQSDIVAAIERAFGRAEEVGRTYVWIVPEPTNPHDQHARAIYLGDRHVGYLPRGVAFLMKDRLDHLARIRMVDGRTVGYPSCLAQIYESPSDDLAWEIALFGPWPTGMDACEFNPDTATSGRPDKSVREAFEDYDKRIASLSPEERARHEERRAQGDRLAEEDEASYQNLVARAERTAMSRHRRIKKDRDAGVVGTLTEIGKRYGMSGIAAGKTLTRHGLREVVAVTVDAFDPVAQAMRQYEEDKRRRWAGHDTRYGVERGSEPAPTEETNDVRRYSRGVVDGFAVWDPVDGREYWIVAKVAPLFESEGLLPD